jgi:hypothetical protein
MLRNREGLAALLAAGAMIVPVALAVPAHATTLSGCTVTPRKPVFAQTWTNDGRKNVTYKVDITCSSGRSIDVTQKRWEADNYSSDDLGGTTYYHLHFDQTDTVTKSVTKPLPTDGVGEGDNYAEVYQKSDFYVTSDDNPPVVSKTTAWESSSIISIHE